MKKNVKNTWKIARDIMGDFLIFLPVLAAIVGAGSLDLASAASYVPIPGTICGEGGFPCPEGTDGIAAAKSIVGKLVDNVRYVIGAVAVVMIVVSGVKLVVSQGNEEVYTKQTDSLIFGILGLFFVGLAGDLANIFEVDRGGFLGDPNVMVQKSRLFNRTIEIVITFIKYTVGGFATFGLIKSALYLLFFGGNEEEVGKEKKNILYALGGLVVILISSPIVNKVFFKIDTSTFPGTDPVRPGIDTGRLIDEVTGITNVVAGIAGPFALLSLVAGGLMYTLSGGDDEQSGKAKKIIMWSLIGLVIIYGAFAIVSTFVARRFEGI